MLDPTNPSDFGHGEMDMVEYKHTMTTMAVPNEVLRLTTPEAAHVLGNNAGMDAFNHDLSFDETLLRDDVQNHSLPSIPFTPSYEFSDAFSSTFEDPFSYQSGAFENLLDEQANPDNGEPSRNDLDNKMLGFGAPIVNLPVLDDGGQTWPTMSAELYGMFFVAEDVFGGENTGRPMELTCYRRNLFQISGSVILSRSISHILNEQGQQVPVYNLTATISAVESIERKATEIISVPWKTSHASTTSEDKSGAAPPQHPLDLSMNPELDPTCVSIPIAWKRLQFKHATANNGRRKGLQQHYVIQINLMATLGTGESVKVAEIQSGPIIVRGRSPRNFDNRKDVPLNEKKMDSKARTMSDAGNTPKRLDPAHNYGFYAQNGLNSMHQSPLELPDWPAQMPHSSDTPRQNKKQILSSNATPSRPPVPKTRWKSESSESKQTRTTAPIDLSLADEDPSRNKSNSLNAGGPASPQHNRKIVSSPVESADLLYEYFPLSLDDWMPPVDAIYRPHVVHHTIVPPDLKAAQVKNKTKRYFSAEDD
ncbi:putative acid phosphatase [Phlyctema vagabunda]|uniref:Acid phosphatase n=1 Tax=Phlyctema vagabunda TaxID=108571 RepID=A0ABR4PC45_9HELO